jgi:hypothetical protein
LLAVQTAHCAVGSRFLRVRLAAVAARAVLTYRPHIDDHPESPAMKQPIQRAVLATLTLAAGLSSAAAAADNAPATESRPVAAFSKIELDVPYDVTVTAQGAPAVDLSGPRKLFANIDTTVVGDTLVVRSHQHAGFNFHFGKRAPQALIHITLPALSSLKAAGSGDVTLERYQGDQLELNLTGAGDLRAAGQSQLLKLHVGGSGDADLRQLKTASLNLRLDGAGDVKAGGITRSLDADLSGSGDFDAGELHASHVAMLMHGAGGVRLAGSGQELRVEVSGSGDFDACALSADSVTALLRGAGNACVAGNIKKFDAEIHGSGDLTARGLQTQTARVQLTSAGNLSLSGSTAALNAEMTGSGDLDARQLLTGHADVVVRGPGSAVVNLQAKSGNNEHSHLLTIDRSGTHNE